MKAEGVLSAAILLQPQITRILHSPKSLKSLVAVQGFGRPVALSGPQLEIQKFHLLPNDAALFLI